MVKKISTVKRKSTSRKKVNKKSYSLAKGAATAVVATTVAGLAAVKAKQMYDNRKKENKPVSQPSVYDNIMSFFGFNKAPTSVDTCKAELNKLKEELSNANKNGAQVDNCKNELNKIKDELQNAKKDLDNYKKYESVIENHVKKLENDLQKAKEDNESLKNEFYVLFNEKINPLLFECLNIKNKLKDKQELVDLYESIQEKKKGFFRRG